MTDPFPKPEPRRRSRARVRMDDLERAAALTWSRKVTAFGCRICPPQDLICEGEVQAHHIIRKQVLRRYIEAETYARDLDAVTVAAMTREILWDTANGLGVCYRAHRRHHNRISPIPLGMLPPAVFLFAARLDLAYILERDYAA